MARTECQECGGRVARRSGTTYECQDCGELVDAADMFLP